MLKRVAAPAAGDPEPGERAAPVQEPAVPEPVVRGQELAAQVPEVDRPAAPAVVATLTQSGAGREQ
jgi:hypothetical protein